MRKMTRAMQAELDAYMQRIRAIRGKDIAVAEWLGWTEIDFRDWTACGPPMLVGNPPHKGEFEPIPHFTADLTSALPLLIAAVWRGMAVQIFPDRGNWHIDCGAWEWDGPFTEAAAAICELILVQ